jgi:sec-independent protein translocase protein TatB
MLDFSWSHIVILLIVALIVVGPKDLPRLMRIVGQWMGKARGMANEFRKSFDDMARQSELDELRKEIENLRHERPFADIEHHLNSSIIPGDMKSPSVTMDAGPLPATAAAEVVEVENPPPPRSGELEIQPRSGELEIQPRDGEFAVTAAPEPVDVGADGYKPPQP